MPLVTAYSEAELSALLIVELSDIATALGWTTATPQITRAVNRTARILGAEIAAVTDMDALEAVATWQGWEVAVGALAASVDENMGGQALSLSQLHTQADKRRLAAKVAALRHDPSYGVTQTTITHTNDLYRYRDAEDWVAVE